MTEPPGLPSPGLPDNRTLQEKDARLNWLRQQVFNSSDLDIPLILVQHIPTLCGRFIFLDSIDAHHDYLLLLRNVSRVETHPVLCAHLADYLPDFGKALQLIRASKPSRLEFWAEVRGAIAKLQGQENEELARRFLQEVFYNELWVDGTCSGCIGRISLVQIEEGEPFRDSLHGEEHQICRSCIPDWVKYSPNFFSQKELDSLFLGVLPGLEDENVFIDFPFAKPQCRASVADHLAREIHGLPLSAIKSISVPQLNIQLSTNLARYTANKLRRLHTFDAGDVSAIRTILRTLYGEAFDITKYGSMTGDDFTLYHLARFPGVQDVLNKLAKFAAGSFASARKIRRIAKAVYSEKTLKELCIEWTIAEPQDI